MFSISPAAKDDLIEIWIFLSEMVSDQFADQFIDDFKEICFALSQDPFLGRSRDEIFFGIRSFPIKRYLLFYDIDDFNNILVRRILHQRRDLINFF